VGCENESRVDNPFFVESLGCGAFAVVEARLVPAGISAVFVAMTGKKRIIGTREGPWNAKMKTVQTITCWLVWTILTGVHGTAAHSQDFEGADDPVVAETGETDRIYLSQVEWEYRSRLDGRELEPALASAVRTAILDQLVNQQLVVGKLSESEFRLTDAELDLKIDTLSAELGKRELTLEKWLADSGQSLASLRFSLRWEDVWARYVGATITDEVLEKYFQRNLTRFDGTRLRVAHLLLACDVKASQADREQLVKQANSIREQLETGAVTWEAAVAKYSSAPTSDTGGDVGWIERDGPMAADFTETAFNLEPGGISAPVQSSAGIHLIRLLETRPGAIPWYQNKGKVRAAAVKELFQRIAAKQRETIPVRIKSPLPWELDSSSGSPDKTDARSSRRP
jgi:parvulin-like peptidyl-prolyl isomerase